MHLLRFVSGPVVFALMLAAGPPGGLGPHAWRTAALAALMAIWWMTEAVPISATALLPLVLLPLLGISGVNAAATPYANPVIFLFFGGFILAAAFEKSGLHRRLALALVARVGTRPDRLIGGFMLAAALISLWVSNTATVLMLLPLASSLLRQAGGAASAAGGDAGAASPFEKALLLSIAYAATIGGLGTIIGTPPNALLAGFMSQTHGIRVGFLDFMLVGLPIVAAGLPLTWLLLTRVIFRGVSREVVISPESISAERERLGPASRDEIFVGVVAAVTAAAWITQPWLSRLIPGLSEAGIGVAAAVALLTIPIGRDWKRVIRWSDAERIPWGVLVLFGGGLSLAGAIDGSGLSLWIGESLRILGGLPPLAIILLMAAIITFLGELTSNTATAAIFLPIASSLAVGAGLEPLLLTVPAALAASVGFMLPVGKPPNAIVFAGGRLTIPEMARAGVLVDVLLISLVTVVSYALVLPVLR
jgi:sodium-dependent dicarboxylate transporter 2/3/5